MNTNEGARITWMHPRATLSLSRDFEVGLTLSADDRKRLARCREAGYGYALTDHFVCYCGGDECAQLCMIGWD